MSKKIAVVGSGCSGIAALWALKNTEHEVHLYEAAARLGGHTNTVTFKGPDGQSTHVDTGFIVLNTATYPNFIAFLKHVHVSTVKTQMTFGVSRNAGDFEWAGTSISAIFAQKQNIFRPRMWRLIFDIIRFNQFAVDVLQDRRNGTSQSHQESVGQYLEREGYSQSFRDDYVIPMTASVWSTNPDKCSLAFPITTLVRFMWNHHLLSTISARPDWLTISGGAQRYIDAVIDGFPQAHVHLKTRITGVVPREDGSVVLVKKDGNETFDHIILATHGDEALDILGQTATQEERSVLSGFQCSKNVAILHSDTSLMPKRRVAWSAWNYITESPFPPSSTTNNISKICLTYWMNLLQHLPEKKFGNVLVTLNPLSPPDPQLVQGIWEYSHPLYSAEAVLSQGMLPGIQNRRGISYCGAWTKYGFHEDGFSSGLAVAMNHLGAKLPFEFVDSTFSRGKEPILSLKDRLLRIVIQLIQLIILIVDTSSAGARSALDRKVMLLRKER